MSHVADEFQISEEDLAELAVLHVEDDAIIQCHLQAILDGKVGELRAASDGEEGLSLYRSFRPDLVISDIRMPRMDGLGMVAAIRETDPEVPVIFTSAYSDSDYLLQAIELGADKYLVKPFCRDQVLRAVRRVSEGAVQRRQIREATRFNRFLLDQSPNYIITVLGERVEYLNRPFLEFLGYRSLEDFLTSGSMIGDLLESIAGHHDRSRLGNWVREINDAQEQSPVVRFKGCGDDQGKAFVVKSNRFPDSERYVITFTDITRIEDERANLAALAHTDHLTGAGNRMSFTACLEQEIVRSNRYGQEFSLIMMDIDDFKKVNDTYGHEEGDRVLRDLADLVRANIRTSDVFARWGGEEFMLLVPGCGAEQAGQMARKIGKLIRDGRLGPAGVTCSFGVAGHRRGEGAAELLRRVDMALYAAKEGGKDRMEFGSGSSSFN